MAPLIPPATPPDHGSVSTWAVNTATMLLVVIGLIGIAALIFAFVVMLYAPHLSPLTRWSKRWAEWRAERRSAPKPPSRMSQDMMKGRIELYRWPDLLAWYDEQAKLAGLAVVHPTDSTVTTEYVSMVK